MECLFETNQPPPLGRGRGGRGWNAYLRLISPTLGEREGGEGMECLFETNQPHPWGEGGGGGDGMLI